MKLKEYLLKLKENIIAKQNKEYLSNEVVTEKEIKCAPKTDEELNEILENNAKTFFPEKGNWWHICYQRSKAFNMINLPCHLRDNLWLAKMFQINNNLSYIDYNKILDFVNNSKIFNELRHNYELEIVRWQIIWMMNDGENWIVDKRLGGDEFAWYPTCDIAFRKGVVDTLTEIGMNLDVIEEGIEKNANIWRDVYMNLAFDREFNKGMILYEMESADPEFKDKWLKMRRIEYYYNHKKFVDKYGVILPEMKMSEEEIDELTTYLTKKSEERKSYIEECKKDPTRKKSLYKILY